MSLLTGHHPGGAARPRGTPLVWALALCHRAGVLLWQAAGRAGCQLEQGQIQRFPLAPWPPKSCPAVRGAGAAPPHLHPMECCLQQPCQGSELPLPTWVPTVPRAVSSDVSLMIKELYIPFGSLFSPGLVSKML